MKLTIARSVLLKVLGHVQSVVEKRNTIPILSNVMIKAEADHIILTATDLDIQVTETAEAAVQTLGTITVPAHMLHDIVRKLPDGIDLQLSVANGFMSIVGDRSRFTLPVLPAEDFPTFGVLEAENSFALPAETLSNFLGKARSAMSNEETRYYLNGVFLHTDSDELFAVSTDGHRLVRIKAKKPNDCSDIKGIIIPRKCVNEVMKVVDEIDQDVRVLGRKLINRVELSLLA